MSSLEWAIVCFTVFGLMVVSFHVGRIVELKRVKRILDKLAKEFSLELQKDGGKDAA